jgi:hypothetical protein
MYLNIYIYITIFCNIFCIYIYKIFERANDLLTMLLILLLLHFFFLFKKKKCFKLFKRVGSGLPDMTRLF